MLGRTSGRFLWCWLSFHFWSSFCYCSSFVNVLHSHFLFDIITFRGLSPGFYTHLILSVQPIAEWFATLSFSAILFVIFLPRALWFWVGIFYPQAFFTLRSFPTFLAFPTFWHNLLLSRFHWELAVTFLKVAGLHTDPRNTDPAHLFVWLTVIHNLLYNLDLYLYMSILQKLLLVVKTLMKILFFSGSVLDKIRLLSRSATTLISNHEDIKQQPH